MKFKPYLRLILILAAAAAVSQFAAPSLAFLQSRPEAGLLTVFFDVAMLFAASFVVFYASSGTVIPSFVVAILFGMAARPFLLGVVEDEAILSVLVGLGATLILFGGGLETPFEKFRQLLWKILSLAFPGVVLTGMLFSAVLLGLGRVTGFEIPAATAVLLGAMLASTDPAAIIPLLKRLRFKDDSTRIVIVSESAVNDAVGALLTVTFLTLLVSGFGIDSVAGGYASLLTPDSAVFLLTQLLVGIVFGVAGYLLLELLTKFKHGHAREFEADTAFFLFVPILIFTAALALGGSGYLAAFIAGLLFNIKEKLHESERFFNRSIDGFLKPLIFLLLGALVEPSVLLSYAPIGVAAALAFIFLIRPLVVFATFGPFAFFGKRRPSWRDILFVSFVRETGAIPAVLIITVAGMGLPNLEPLAAVGMWVILLTLLIEPPVTPWVAKKLGVAEEIDETAVADIEDGKPFVVLGSRGYSFMERLPTVAEWASRHHITRVVLLLCLEHRYEPKRVETIERDAKRKFKDTVAELRKKNMEPVEIEFVSNKGFLQDNISHLAKTEKDLVTIFVGRRVLDYRLEEIKRLDVPLYFMD